LNQAQGFFEFEKMCQKPNHKVLNFEKWRLKLTLGDLMKDC
jgi:hypothetical protein